MPKIRLSALATDMKGKAGGSVFSTNSGGVYFRNNPSGTSSKKPSNGLRKQMFATLAQSWKLLTEEEMQAWADAGILYPTTNAWGETRIPKGFELYMRLNMNLRAAGVEPLTLPVTPRAIPSVLSAEMIWTDEFQLIPTSFFACQSMVDTSEFYHPTIFSFLASSDLSNDRFISFRTSINPPHKGTRFIPSSILLFSLRDVDRNGMEIYAMDLLTASPMLVVIFNTSTGQLTRAYDVAPSILETDFHIGYQLTMGDLETGSLYVNGVLLTPDDKVKGTLTFDTLTADLCLFPDSNFGDYRVLFSDFRIYNDVLAASKAHAISHGYVFNDEYILIPMNVMNVNTFVNYTTAGDAQLMELVATPPIMAVFFPYNPRLLPNITIEVNGIEEEGFGLKILCTQFVSGGKAVVSNTFKLCETQAWSADTIYNPQQGMKSLLYSTMANASINFRIQCIDSTTGALGVDVNCKPKRPRNNPRFKAGAELSGKVN